MGHQDYWVLLAALGFDGILNIAGGLILWRSMPRDLLDRLYRVR